MTRPEFLIPLRPPLRFGLVVALLLGAATVDDAEASSPPVAAAAAPERSPTTAQYVSGGLTADDVAKRAAATSVDVRVHERERAAAEAALDQAVAGYLPRLSGTLRYTRLSALDAPPLGNLVVAPTLPGGPIAPGTPLDRLSVASLSFPVLREQWAAQATLQIPLSDYILRIPQQEAAANGNVRAAALATRAARLNAATEARIAYYGWVRARMQTQVAQAAVAQVRAHLAEVSRAEEAGAVSKADVLRVTSQLAAAETMETRAHSLVAISEQDLHTLMHDDPAVPLDIGEDVTASVAQAAALTGEPTEEPDGHALVSSATPALWEEARLQRLERRALGESADALRQQARAVRAAGLPRLDAVGNLISANPNPRVFPQQDKFTTTWDAGVQLSWTPTELFATEAGVRGTQARAGALDAQQAALDDALRAQVTQAVQMTVEARAAAASAQRGLLAAEESYRVRRLLFQNGRATSVEQTDAETELTRARMEVVNAQVDVRMASVRLRHALGRDSDDAELPRARKD